MIGLNWTLTLSLLVFALFSTGASGETPKGLMWNKSGLPAVFPLIVQTDPGRDYVLLLRDGEIAEPVLAAYAVGGEQLRVLVPPGTFFLQALYGTGWDADQTRFTDAGAGQYDHPDPLTFQVEGLAAKAGHSLDLRGLHDVQAQAPSVTAHRLCRTLRTRVDRPTILLTRPEFDRAWRDNQRRLLPDGTRVPSARGPEVARPQDSALIDLSRRDTAFLRYQNNQPPFGILPPDAPLRITRDVRATLCD